MITFASIDRPAQLRRGLRLEYLTVSWNLVEGILAVAVALAAGSVALLGFASVTEVRAVGCLRSAGQPVAGEGG